MFFHLQLNKDIEVEPRHFGPNLQQILKQKVTSEASICWRAWFEASSSLSSLLYTSSFV